MAKGTARRGKWASFAKLEERLNQLVQAHAERSTSKGPPPALDALIKSLPVREAPFTTGSPACKLFVIQARQAPYAIVMRRGPSKQVQLIGWHTDSDTFEPGQWFKGRVYERRCDLSPDGRYLVYFAAKFTGPLYSWTAISKPPYFTALALWPKGDCWAGGGLFEGARSLWLNDSPEAEPLPQLKLPKNLLVWSKSWGGEDSPIYDLRLLRDGWKFARPGRFIRLSMKEQDRIGLSYPLDPPVVWERLSPASNSSALLRMLVYGYGEQGGDWNVQTFEVENTDGSVCSLGRLDWADWNANGNLLYAADGKLFRLSPSRLGYFDLEKSRELADFRDHRFRAIPPPEWATRW